MPTVTMTNDSAWCSTSPIGRMITRSMRAPPRNEIAIEATIANAMGAPHSQNCQVRNVEKSAISPWAKFTNPVDR